MGSDEEGRQHFADAAAKPRFSVVQSASRLDIPWNRAVSSREGWPGERQSKE